MREEYDFSHAVKNPYSAKLKAKNKKSITIRLDNVAIDYFKQLAEEMDIPYQTLINYYLTDCAKKHLKPSIHWR